MINFSRLGFLTCLFAGLAFAAVATAQTSAAPKGDKEGAAKDGAKDELSVKSVKLITGFALTTIPSEIKQPDGKVLKIDRSNLEKILVPLEDARRIIMTARNSAHAQMCDMPELQAENYLALMRGEQAKKKWTQEQMLFINRLHLFTVMWLTGNVKFLEKDGKKEPTVISEPDKGEKKVCSPEEKDNVKANIEAFLKSVQKS
ncbi:MULTISPECIES: hypothetical protein [Rhodomicrobium]|uniref:hypothetical protein n=1 Tax=Rhodomicrobium TaxID=1068 RepID=UPI000B4AE181|nr:MULTISPECIES: hypothetical protein [Rhodomicrobium]